MNKKQSVWTIVGGGNGGQSLAGHLGLMGFETRIYDIMEDTIDIINEQGGVFLTEGVVEGFGKVAFATTDLGKAVKGADIIMVVAPALAHGIIASDLSEFLEDGQIVFIHPGATGGALEFKKILADKKCKANVIISEAMSLIYACRSPRKGTASIKGIKQTLLVAALPANRTEEVLEKLQQAFPQMVGAQNVLQTSLENLNAVMHPGPTLLNTANIESDRSWLYYYDGITPSIGRFVEALDEERRAVGKALGLELNSVVKWYNLLYGATGANLTEIVRSNPAYAEISGQKSLNTRYVLEDIPMGLVPMKAFGELLGVATGHMDTIIELGGYLLDKDFMVSGRTLEKLGLAGMSKEEILHFVETGEK